MNVPYATTRIIRIGNCELTVSVANSSIKGYSITNSHYHLHFELHFISGGEIEFTANGKETIAGNKETVIIPPHVVHSIKDNEGCERFCITFLMKRINTPDPDMTYENILSRWNAITDLTVLKKSYVKEFQKIMNFLKANDTFHNASAKHLLALLLLDISDTLIPSEIKDVPQRDEMDEQYYRSKVIEDCIDIHYQNSNANICLVANILHLSTKQAERTVKMLTGMSFKQLLLKKRMHLAKEMILTSDKKLYEIAQCVGYNSYEVFYKAFSKHFDTTPTKLKSKLEEKKE